MSNALAGVAYDSVLKYAPIEALHERAVRQTIHACMLLFPLEQADQIAQIAEEVWRLHVVRHGDLHLHQESGLKWRDVLEARGMPADTPEYQAMREKLRQHLGDLSQRERQVIELRFGLLDDHCYSIEEIGHRMRVTRERIRQIEERALRKLRDYLA
jgi:RNA polymerase sigma factor (sigma-70 family)